MGWAPFLDPELREQAGGRDAGLACARASRGARNPEAERVSELAEDRLRTLRPDVMEGTDPVEAMRRVADAFDAPTVRTGQPAPVRAALPEWDRTRRPGDAEIVRYVGSTAAAPVAVGGHTYPAGRSPAHRLDRIGAFHHVRSQRAQPVLGQLTHPLGLRVPGATAGRARRPARHRARRPARAARGRGTAPSPSGRWA